jgi:alpha-methylacyl-CoA racemase
MYYEQFLDDVRILTTAQNVPGPLAVARMQRSGARVTKIEPPTGDRLQLIAPAWYVELHVGVTIERLDLKSDTGRERLTTLLASADVLLTSQRPSQLAHLRLDLDTLRAQYPRLRTVRIVGSVDDPERAGHDLTYQARVGLLGDAMPLTLAADVMASERAFAGVLALLRQPPGSTTDVGIVESLEPLVAPLRHGLTAPNGPLGGGLPYYRVYRARDGRVAVAALEPHFEERLYKELGLSRDSDLSTRFLERTALEWDSWAEERDLPISAVRDR